MSKYTYTTSPLDLIAEKREELSYQYRQLLQSKRRWWQRRSLDDEYWVGVWIAEYDKAIRALSTGRSADNG